jgi:hypothetical protein
MSPAQRREREFVPVAFGLLALFAANVLLRIAGYGGFRLVFVLVQTAIVGFFLWRWRGGSRKRRQRRAHRRLSKTEAEEREERRLWAEGLRTAARDEE